MKMSRSILKRKEDRILPSASKEDSPPNKKKKFELKLDDMDSKMMDSMVKDIFASLLRRTNRYAMGMKIVNAAQNLKDVKVREITLSLVVEKKEEENDVYDIKKSSNQGDDSKIDENKKESFLKMKERIDKILKK